LFFQGVSLSEFLTKIAQIVIVATLYMFALKNLYRNKFGGRLVAADP
jgi:hypothetical protein